MPHRNRRAATAPAPPRSRPSTSDDQSSTHTTARSWRTPVGATPTARSARTTGASGFQARISSSVCSTPSRGAESAFARTIASAAAMRSASSVGVRRSEQIHDDELEIRVDPRTRAAAAVPHDDPARAGLARGRSGARLPDRARSRRGSRPPRAARALRALRWDEARRARRGPGRPSWRTGPRAAGSRWDAGPRRPTAPTPATFVRHDASSPSSRIPSTAHRRRRRVPRRHPSAPDPADRRRGRGPGPRLDRDPRRGLAIHEHHDDRRRGPQGSRSSGTPADRTAHSSVRPDPRTRAPRRRRWTPRRPARSHPHRRSTSSATCRSRSPITRSRFAPS